MSSEKSTAATAVCLCVHLSFLRKLFSSLFSALALRGCAGCSPAAASGLFLAATPPGAEPGLRQPRGLGWAALCRQDLPRPGASACPALAGGFSPRATSEARSHCFRYSLGYFLVYSSMYVYLCVYTLKTFNTIWQTIFFLPTAYNGYWDNWTSIIFLKSVCCTFSTLVSLFEFWLSFPSYWLAVYTFYFYYFNVCS